MEHPVVSKIIKEGVTSVDTSMLSPELRNRLMSEAGDRLIHMNRVSEAAEAYALGDNIAKLWEMGRWYLEQRKYGDAALFMRHVARDEALIELAEKCITAGEISPAKKIYESLGDNTMVQFLEQNFK